VVDAMEPEIDAEIAAWNTYLAEAGK